MNKEASVGSRKPNKFNKIAMGVITSGVMMLPFAKPSHAEGPLNPNSIPIPNVVSQADSHPYKLFVAASHDGIAVTGVSIGPLETVRQPAPEPEVLMPGCPVIISRALGYAGCAVSFCESKWDQNATGSIGEKGWFQINPWVHPDATYDPEGNVAAAIRISDGGANWGPWSVRGVLINGGYCPNGESVPR